MRRSAFPSFVNSLQLLLVITIVSTAAARELPLIQTPTAMVSLPAADIKQPQAGTRKFVSALLNARSGAVFNLTFGTDSSLVVTTG